MEFLDAQNRLIAAPEPIWIRSPKRVRVRFGGETIADSTRRASSDPAARPSTTSLAPTSAKTPSPPAGAPSPARAER